MIRRNLFFWIARLQITPSERVCVIVLCSGLIFITSARLFWEAGSAYDEEFYRPIEAEFNRLSAIRQEEELALLSRYYPPLDSGTKEPQEAFVTNQTLPLDILGIEVDSDSLDVSPVPAYININTATAGDLTRLPGIGPVIAERIILYRDEYGVFENFNDLLHIRGIGAARLEQIKPYLKL